MHDRLQDKKESLWSRFIGCRTFRTVSRKSLRNDAGQVEEAAGQAGLATGEKE
jgi:hypothetical protein